MQPHDLRAPGHRCSFFARGRALAFVRLGRADLVGGFSGSYLGSDGFPKRSQRDCWGGKSQAPSQSRESGMSSFACVMSPSASSNSADEHVGVRTRFLSRGSAELDLSPQKGRKNLSRPPQGAFLRLLKKAFPTVVRSPQP